MSLETINNFSTKNNPQITNTLKAASTNNFNNNAITKMLNGPSANININELKKLINELISQINDYSQQACSNTQTKPNIQMMTQNNKSHFGKGNPIIDFGSHLPAGQNTIQAPQIQPNQVQIPQQVGQVQPQGSAQIALNPTQAQSTFQVPLNQAQAPQVGNLVRVPPMANAINTQIVPAQQNTPVVNTLSGAAGSVAPITQTDTQQTVGEIATAPTSSSNAVNSRLEALSGVSATTTAPGDSSAGAA